MRLLQLLALAVLAALCAQMSYAEEMQARKVKAPWEWTDEERLAKRFDPADIQERFEDAARREDAVTAALPHLNQDKTMVRIYGDKNPELFLAWEVFRNFIGGPLFSEDPEIRETFRLSVAEQHPDLPLDEEFWLTVESASADFLDHLRKEKAAFAVANELPPEQAKAEIDAYLATRNDRDLCRMRTDTLERVRQAVGRVLIDRILYETTAPTMALAHQRSLGPEHFQFIAGGCRE